MEEFIPTSPQLLCSAVYSHLSPWHTDFPFTHRRQPYFLLCWKSRTLYIHLSCSYHFPPSLANISGSIFHILPLTAGIALPPIFTSLRNAHLLLSSVCILKFFPSTDSFPAKPHLPQTWYCPLSLILLVWTLLKVFCFCFFLDNILILFSSHKLRKKHKADPNLSQGI